MRGVLAAIAGFAALASGSACAMSTEVPPAAACRVIGGEKLPAESGGADALCKAIAEAVAAQAPGVAYRVEVTVVAESRLSASITAGDRKLADRGFSRMDRPLTNEAYKRFARAIAEDLAQAGTDKS